MPEQLRCSERRILEALRARPSQSYEDIAIATEFARCTVYGIIRRLEVHGKIKKTTGKGRNPNRYVLL